jgi:integrase/recombinase XerD
MLEQLFPRAHRRYTSLAVFGPAVEGFFGFLLERGYPRTRLPSYLWPTQKIDAKLRAIGCHSLAELTRSALRRSSPLPGHAHEDPFVSATVRLWEKYLGEQGLLEQPPLSGPADEFLPDYERHLLRVRGFAVRTVGAHLRTATEFLSGLETVDVREKLSQLTAKDIEAFLERAARRLSRETVQHVVAQLRSLLRYLVARGQAPNGLDAQIDTPRLYRGEKLPRSLPWPLVCRYLESIDRSTRLGKRDYAIFQLITNYGLRSSEVVAVTLEDIEWRQGRLRVEQRKTSSPLYFPLTDSVGASLAEYLRHGRPEVDCREVFVRHRAPAGPLKATGVAEAFQAWSRRSGLPIPFQGAHCLRHSYAVHLLRRGASIKAIGDLLGHRNAESTYVYLRLAVEDLREVALEIPSAEAEEVRP